MRRTNNNAGDKIMKRLEKMGQASNNDIYILFVLFLYKYNQDFLFLKYILKLIFLFLSEYIDDTVKLGSIS